MSTSFSVSWLGGNYQQEVLAEKLPVDIHEEDFFLNVPFEDKDDVKSLGCKWNKEVKKWFVPKGTDVNRFKKWHPQLLPIASGSGNKEQKKIDMNMGFSTSDEDEDKDKDGDEDQVEDQDENQDDKDHEMNEEYNHETVHTPNTTELTEEQKQKIERNRLMAMEKRRLKLLEKEQEQSTGEVVKRLQSYDTDTMITSIPKTPKGKTNEEVTRSDNDPDVCKICHERPADVTFRRSYTKRASCLF